MCFRSKLCKIILKLVKMKVSESNFCLTKSQFFIFDRENIKNKITDISTNIDSTDSVNVHFIIIH